MSDSTTGFDRAPDRYSGQDRETCDRMRDGAFKRARVFQGALGDILHLADWMFAYACETHALKYEDRAGRKGDAAEDLDKARWWREMAAHVRGEGDDPRSSRESFVPYEYQEAQGV